MYKVFIDANVLIEHAAQRKNFQDVVEVFKLAETHKIECYAASSSFYTLVFILESEPAVKQIIKNYLTFLHPLSTDENVFSLALASSFKDVEDSFQYYTALSSCNYFLTYNIKDFKKHTTEQLPCMTPAQFLQHIKLKNI